MLLVDTVVHHGHLHAVSPGSGQTGERRRADHGRPAVEVEVIRQARVDVSSDVRLEEVPADGCKGH